MLDPGQIGECPEETLQLSVTGKERFFINQHAALAAPVPDQCRLNVRRMLSFRNALFPQERFVSLRAQIFPTYDLKHFTHRLIYVHRLSVGGRMPNPQLFQTLGLVVLVELFISQAHYERPIFESPATGHRGPPRGAGYRSGIHRAARRYVRPDRESER